MSTNKACSLLTSLKARGWFVSLLDGHSEMAPPDPFPNSAVKRLSADGSAVRPCESRSPSSFFCCRGNRVMDAISKASLLLFLVALHLPAAAKD